MDTFKGWERCWGPERTYARTVLCIELEAFGGGVRAGIQPLRWGIGASLHISDDTRMVFVAIGPFHAQAHCTNNAPEAVAAREKRRERSFERVLQELEKRRTGGLTP
jgi:hypothetical protein